MPLKTTVKMNNLNAHASSDRFKIVSPQIGAGCRLKKPSRNDAPYKPVNFYPLNYLSG
jgi:hypothetical protein